MSKTLAQFITFSAIAALAVGCFIVGLILPFDAAAAALSAAAVVGFVGALLIRLGAGGAAGFALSVIGAGLTGVWVPKLVLFGGMFLQSTLIAFGLAALGLAGLAVAVSEVIDHQNAGAAR